jgi:hypothetical protein
VRAILAEASAAGIDNTRLRDAALLIGTDDKKRHVLSSLQAAIDGRDAANINKYLEEAIGLGLKDTPEVLAAQTMSEQLAQDLEVAGELNATIKTIENNFSGRAGVSMEDLAALTTATDVVRGKGLSEESPYLVKAVALKEKIETVLVIQKDIEGALGEGRLRDLKKSVDKLEDLGMSNTVLIQQARARIRELESERARKAAADEDGDDEDVPILDDDEMRRAREEKLQKARDPRFHFTNFARIRSDDEFAKGLLLNKSKAKKQKLQYQSSPLHKSILDLVTKELNKAAIGIHRNLLGYTGDKSMSFPTTLAQDILEKGCTMPSLVDEIYIQICKHLTHNPRPESQVRAWQVMCMAVGTFPPSGDFENYLINFILQHTEAGGSIGNYARYALRRLEGILNSGPSGFWPSVDELHAYSERNPILATIELVDGIPLTEELPVTPDLDVGKVLDICIHFMELQDPRARQFGLFVEDVDDDAENPGYNPLVAKGVCEALPKTPRPLPNNAFLGDIATAKIRQNQKYKFVFKRKITLRSSDEPSEDPMFTRLLYQQCIDEIIKGNIPIDEEDEVAKMVSDFLAVEFAEETPDNADDLIDPEFGSLDTWLPVAWRHKLDIQDWAKKVLMHREDSVNRDPDELQAEIIEQVKEHPLYGTHFFHVKRQIAKTPQAYQSFPERLVLAYNSEGLHILDENLDCLSSVGYSQIYRWGGSSTQLSLLIYSEEAQDVQEFCVWTSQAADQASIILETINAIMEAMG